MPTHRRSPRPPLDLVAVRQRYLRVLGSRTPAALRAALADIPVLVAEIERSRSLLTLTRIRYVDLVASARATLRAHHDAENDPLWYLRDELRAQGWTPLPLVPPSRPRTRRHTGGGR